MIFKQSTAIKIPFYLVSSTDNVSPITGLGSGPVVTLAKDGAAFGAAGGTVAEIGNGWYYLSANTTDTGTLGSLTLHATGTGAIAADDLHQVCVDLPGGTVASVTGAVGSVTGAVGSVTGLTASNLDTTVSSRLATSGYTAPDNASISAIGVIVTAIKVTTDKFLFDGSNFVKAATQTLAAGAVQAIWDALTSALTTTGSIGKYILTNLDAPVSAGSTLGGIRRNVGVTGFQFRMFNDDGTPGLNLTLTGKVSLDGGAFTDLTNAAVEIGNGWYKIDLANADVNGKIVALKFNGGTGVQETPVSIVTDT